MRNKFQKAIQDTKGAEVLEFLGTFWWLILLVFAMIMVACYVYNESKLNDLGKRIVRMTETSGEYDTAEISSLVKSLYYGDEPVSITAYLTNGTSDTSATVLHNGNKIQLRQNFMVKLDSYYRPRLLNKSAAKFPMHVVVHGMSEVYNQDTSSDGTTVDSSTSTSGDSSALSADTIVVNPTNYDAALDSASDKKAAAYASAHPSTSFSSTASAITKSVG